MVSSIGGFSYISTNRSGRSGQFGKSGRSGRKDNFSRKRSSRDNNFGGGFSDFTGLLTRLFSRLTNSRRNG